MNLIFDNQQFDRVLEENELVLAYFSGVNCNVCNALKPKIESLVNEQFPLVKLIDIPTENSPELIARFCIFTIPGIMFFVEGRESIREVRNISTVEILNKMQKIITLYQS